MIVNSDLWNCGTVEQLKMKNINQRNIISKQQKSCFYYFKCLKTIDTDREPQRCGNDSVWFSSGWRCAYH